MAIPYDARDKYLSRRDKGQRTEIVTPEGTVLSFTVAAAGDRVNAFLIDMAICFVTILVLALLTVWAVGGGAGTWLGAFLQLVVFLLGNFYFTWFELKWQGTTPGKRMVGIRVIDAQGGPLTADAVIGRNLMRQIEILIPLGLIANPDALWAGAPGWARALSFVWLLVFALMPFWNKHRLRIGDMVAGTMVVLAPKAVLLTDIATVGRPLAAGAGAGASAGLGVGIGVGVGASTTPATEFTFTKEQLDIYGIYELQVLEDVLRQDEDGKADPATLDLVCDKIKVKIGWDRMQWRVDPRRFLREFYAALRARLEHKMLFGKRQEDKYSK